MDLSIWWFEMFCESLCCCLWEANESVALYGRQPTVFWFGNTAFGQLGSLEEGLAGRTVVNKIIFSLHKSRSELPLGPEQWNTTFTQTKLSFKLWCWVLQTGSTSFGAVNLWRTKGDSPKVPQTRKCWAPNDPTVKMWSPYLRGPNVT